MEVGIGLDLGTTRCKAVALGEGRVLAQSRRSYPLLQGEPGQAEQDVNEVITAAVAVLRELREQLGDTKPVGLAFSGAMHSLLAVDAAGTPLAPALTWADTRPGSVLGDLPLSPLEAYRRTGCPLQAPYYPAKLAWLRRTHPALLERASSLVAIKDYVAFRLTGRWAADVGLASTTGLLNLHTGAWDEEILGALGLPPERLLPVLDATERLGHLSPAMAEATGLPLGLPVYAGSSDGGLANLGAGAGVGEAVITVGTSAALRQVVAQPRLEPGARTWCYFLDRQRWLAGGAVNNAGLLLEWLRSRFYGEYPRGDGFARLFTDAEAVEPGAEGLTLLPYLSGERSPHWRSDLSATVHGLRLRHTRAHLARAGLEAVAFCLAQLWESLCPGLERVKLTGSITASPPWMQILADVLQAEVVPVDAADASAVGAAMLAGGSAGGVPRPANPPFQPNPSLAPAYREARGRFEALFSKLWE